MPSPSSVSLRLRIGIGVVALSFILIVTAGVSESFAVFLLPLSVDLAEGRCDLGLRDHDDRLRPGFAVGRHFVDRFGPRVTYGLGRCLVLGYGTTGWLDSLWSTCSWGFRRRRAAAGLSASARSAAGFRTPDHGDGHRVLGPWVRRVVFRAGR